MLLDSILSWAARPSITPLPSEPSRETLTMNHLQLRRYRREDRAACLALFEGNIPDSFLPHEIPLFMEFLDWFTGPYLVMEEAGTGLVACGGLAEHAEHATL